MKHSLQRVLLVLFLGVLGFHFSASSQEIPDIDKLTDDQLKSFLQKAEEGGYTEDQLIIGAKARGMSDVEISKLRQRINKLKTGGTKEGANELNALSDSRMRQEKEEEEDLFDPFGELMGEKTDTLPKIFGMDSPSSTIVGSYLLSPGSKALTKSVVGHRNP